MVVTVAYLVFDPLLSFVIIVKEITLVVVIMAVIFATISHIVHLCIVCSQVDLIPCETYYVHLTLKREFRVYLI